MARLLSGRFPGGVPGLGGVQLAASDVVIPTGPHQQHHGGGRTASTDHLHDQRAAVTTARRSRRGTACYLSEATTRSRRDFRYIRFFARRTERLPRRRPRLSLDPAGHRCDISPSEAAVGPERARSADADEIVGHAIRHVGDRAAEIASGGDVVPASVSVMEEHDAAVPLHAAAS